MKRRLRLPAKVRGERYSLGGRIENGEGIYTSNFNANTPRQVESDRFVDIWQNIWSKKPFDLEIVGADGNTRTVTANFNPDYDPENQRMTDLGKVLHSRNGSSGDRTSTLNLADDLPDIASESSYDDSKNESGKIIPTHDGVTV